MKFTKLTWLVFICSILSFNSCKMDPNWDTEWEAPLAKLKLTPANVFPIGDVQADQNGDLTYVFDKNVFTLPVDSILNIPDTNIVYSFTAPLNLNVQPGNTFLVFNNYLNFNITQAELIEALLSEGDVELEISSFAPQPLTMVVEFPKALKNGQIFSHTETLAAANGSSPSVLNTSKSLHGYSVNFTGDNGTLSNRLRLMIYATVPTSAQPFTIPQGSQLVSLNFRLKKLKPHFARGKIKSQTVDFSQDTLDIKALRIVKSGTINLQDLLMNLKITNGVGVDLRVKINELVGFNSNKGTTVALNHPIIGGIININRAINQQWSNPEYIATVQNVLFNSGNSNLIDFVENLPDKIGLKATFIINPQGPSSGGNDFIYGNSSSSLHLRVEAPLSFSLDQVVLSDTVKLDMQKLLGKENVKGIGFVLWAQNNFPLAAHAQMYFEDNNGTVLDSLFFQSELQPAIINGSNQAITPVVSEIAGSLLEENIKNVRAATRVRFKIKLNTSGLPGLTHWKDSYYLDLRLRAKLKFTI